MPGERYRHIFIQAPTRTEWFTNPRRGGSDPRIRTRDRESHADYLMECFRRAWSLQDDSNQLDAATHVERRGTYLEFVGEPGYDLMVKSLEAIRSGIRLLNVRTETRGNDEVTLAIVYVPNEKRALFLRKLTAYSQEIDLRSGRPRNERLVNSISHVRRAVLKSFWREDEWTEWEDEDPVWLEVWLSSDSDELVHEFDSLCASLEITVAEGQIRFPERSVKLVFAAKSQLQNLIENSDDIAEFRMAHRLAAGVIESANPEQIELVEGILARCDFQNISGVAVCVLDTGVNSGHQLLQPVLPTSDLHAVKSIWGTHDHNGHGTLMAGTAQYGDILKLIEGNEGIKITHGLESVKILPPPPDQNPKKLWGYITLQAVSLAEIESPERTRVVCMAVTAIDDRDRGRPSSWSGAVDELSSGAADDRQRLVIISAGNVDASGWSNYPNDNLTNEVHDPGQAWNALTIGAFTEKTEIQDPTLEDFTPVGGYGELSPHSTTSVDWPQRKWPIKPDVVMEGGNVAIDSRGFPTCPDDLSLISTSHSPLLTQFAPFFATSASSALGANMAAKLFAAYPAIWPETVRALIVHSAEWTDSLKQQFLPAKPRKTDYARLLRICGYGVPDLARAMYCRSNSVTLVSQAFLQPYDRKNSRYVTRDMHLYNLPWPTDVLADLGELEVRMKVTLSYFVEPGPGEIGWDDRYRYPSYALRFDVNGPGETEIEFIQRVNVQAREDGQHPGTEGAQSRWIIGEARNVGSIHSDTWIGTAADLAASNLIAIYPGVGWWRERHHLKRWGRRCRYSLCVSIITPMQEIDVYTPVALQLDIQQPVEIEI